MAQPRWMTHLVSLLLFPLGYTVLISVFAGIKLWEAATHTPLSGTIQAMLYGAAFAHASYSNWLEQRLRADSAESALAAYREKQSTPRSFVHNPQPLFERQAQTGLLADSLLNPYLDKWITVSGGFEGAAESLLHDALHLSVALECGRRVNLRFAMDDRKSLDALQPGQQITAICQVKHGRGLGVFSLENSEIVRVQPLRQRITKLTARSA